MPDAWIDKRVTDAITIIVGRGGRMLPKPKALELTRNDPFIQLWYPDDRIHKAAPGPDRANFRSATPRGFCRATYEANRPDRIQLDGYQGSILHERVMQYEAARVA